MIDHIELIVHLNNPEFEWKWINFPHQRHLFIPNPWHFVVDMLVYPWLLAFYFCCYNACLPLTPDTFSYKCSYFSLAFDILFFCDDICLSLAYNVFILSCTAYLSLALNTFCSRGACLSLVLNVCYDNTFCSRGTFVMTTLVLSLASSVLFCYVVLVYPLPLTLLVVEVLVYP